MFATPAQTNLNGDTVYIVKLIKPEPIGIRLSVEATGIVPTLAYQDQLQVFRKRILTELSNHKQLFRHAPSLESLEAITPMWGFIVKDSSIVRSPYTQIESHVDSSQIPYDADLELTALIVSRSTIRPMFETVYLKSAGVIDFDWGMDEVDAELEEVSDIPADTDLTHSLELRDPVSIRRTMAKEKEAVRAAFRRAEDARVAAETMATRFYTNYDLSDSESAFSEWVSSDEEGDS